MAESGCPHGSGLPAPTHIFLRLGTRRDGTRPSYWWSILRYRQAHQTALQLIPIIHRMQQRIDTANGEWPLVRCIPDESQPGGLRLEPQGGPHPIRLEDMREASFIASETLHYLRSSLDYLVNNAIWIEHGPPHPMAQFPICSSRKRWDDKRTSELLHGMPHYQRTWIERVQPFNGVKWTKRLQDLSNADKHRVGVVLSPECQLTVNVAEAIDDPKNAGCKLAQVEDTVLRFLLHDLSPTGEFLDVFNSMFTGAGELINSFVISYRLPAMEVLRIKLPC
jgi:hypothetical protein